MSSDYFMDRSGWTPDELDLWEPIKISKEEIDEEILHSAEVEYEALLQKNIYDKINPEEL